jgi:hypothetical protein
LRHENDSLADGLPNFIDGVLQALGIVGEAVATHAEAVRRPVDRLGVVQTNRVAGRGFISDYS